MQAANKPSAMRMLKRAKANSEAQQGIYAGGAGGAAAAAAAMGTIATAATIAPAATEPGAAATAAAEASEMASMRVSFVISSMDTSSPPLKRRPCRGGAR